MRPSVHRLILGVRLDGTSHADATARVMAWARAGESRFVCAVNVHTIMEAQDAPELRALVNHADLNTPDGMPVVWALRALGWPQAERVDGPTLTLRVCEAAARAGVPIGLYGSTPESLRAFTDFVQRTWPAARIACAISPPFRPLTPAEDEEYIRQINESGARILLVCLGCPKQERWMAERRGRVRAVMLGIGAAVDFHGGRVARAPRWMQQRGLEWLYRLGQEPRRLAARYFRHNPRFLLRLARQVRQPSPRPWILMYGYRPPPYFGPATAYEALLNSSFGRDFDMTFVNLSVVGDLRDLEMFRLRKLWDFAFFFGETLRRLATRRYAFCCYPISFNTTALLKDAALLAPVRWRGVKVVLFTHGNNLPDFARRAPRWVQWVMRRTINRADAAIILGENLRFNYADRLPADRVFVVPLGIEDEPPLPVRQRTDAAVRVLFLGNLIPEKGYRVLLEAAPAILAQAPQTRFVFAGAWWRDDVRAETLEFVRRNGLEERVTFAGVVTGEKKWQTLVDADVLAFPTFYQLESFGFVLLEAMRAGLPVVTTRRGAIPEIIQDGVNGFLVAEQSPEDLAEKLVKLIRDPALRQQMGAANRERFASFYTHEHFGRRLAAVFRQLS